jgi:hypothetical protein
MTARYLDLADAILLFEEQRGRRILCLKYDVLWERRDMLSEFVGFDVPLPPRTSRGVPRSRSDLVARARDEAAG